MRRLKATSILSDDEVRLILVQLQETLPSVLEAGAALGLDAEATVRFGAVAAKCREARARSGWTLKEAAAALRVPQYRLRAIESGIRSELRADILESYISCLGLESWFTRWRRSNAALAHEFGLTRVGPVG